MMYGTVLSFPFLPKLIKDQHSFLPNSAERCD